MSDSLWPHESQHARPPCPSPSPGVHSDSRPFSLDAIQPSHPGSSPSPPAPDLSQHQSLFQWVNSSHEAAKVLEFFSFSVIPSKEIPGLIFRMDWLDLLGLPKHIFCLIYQLYNPESTHQVLWFLSFSLSWVPHEKLCFLSCPSIWSSRSAISDLVPLFFPWLSYCFTIYSLIENHIGFVNPTCFTVFWCST